MRQKSLTTAKYIIAVFLAKDCSRFQYVMPWGRMSAHAIWWPGESSNQRSGVVWFSDEITLWHQMKLWRQFLFPWKIGKLWSVARKLRSHRSSTDSEPAKKVSAIAYSHCILKQRVPMTDVPETPFFAVNSIFSHRLVKSGRGKNCRFTLSFLTFH